MTWNSTQRFKSSEFSAYNSFKKVYLQINSQIMNEFDASSIEFPARKDFF